MLCNTTTQAFLCSLIPSGNLSACSQWKPCASLAGLPAGRGIMSTSSTTIGWKRFEKHPSLLLLLFVFLFLLRKSFTDSSVCVELPSVCAGRLPHRAVHSAEHHHAGKAADPEQHLWNRHPVSGPHSVIFIMLRLCAAHYLGPVVKPAENTCRMPLLRSYMSNTPPYLLINTGGTKKILLPFKDIPLASVCTALIHVRRRGFYMQIPGGSGGSSV